MEWWQSFKDWFLGLDPPEEVSRTASAAYWFLFLSACLYLIIAGRNIPWWVYALIAALVAYGVYATWQKIKKGTLQKQSP